MLTGIAHIIVPLVVEQELINLTIQILLLMSPMILLFFITKH